MLYRLCLPEDFPQLYAIEKVCFQPPFRFGRRFMRQLLDSSSAAAWIAEEDERMAGFAIADWTRDAGETIAYIETLEVAPGQRRRGVGSRLLHCIENSARAAGARILWLHVDAENVPAIRLYQAHGYLCEGREEDYYAPGLPALIFAKSLEPVAA